jgi:hypothetical protein
MTIEIVDEQRLDSDVVYRYGFVTRFMGFDDSDVAAVHGAAAHLAPLVPGLVDAVYDKLFAFTATKRQFLPRQHGHDGAVPSDLEHLTLDHEQIAFRKKHLATYLVKLVSSPFDEKLIGYLDAVGRIHTAKAGNPDIEVPLVQVFALMGFVNDALLATIDGLAIPADAKLKASRALTKLLWIQADLFVRHYH